MGERDKQQMYQALAGAHAVEKVTPYIQMLYAIDKERNRIGIEIHRLHEVVEKQITIDPRLAAEAETEAVSLAGLQEVTYHLFSSCVMAIHGLLPLVAKSTGYKLPRAYKEVLESYKPLRDYFEHMEERAPGKKHQSEVVTESLDGEKWRIASGFKFDDEGRMVFKGKTIDLTTRGLEAIESMLDRVSLEIRASCIQQIRDYFLQYPESPPSPEQVPCELLVKVHPKS